MKPNFACFSLSKFFWGASPEILNRRNKIRPNADQRAKFYAGRPTHLKDLALQKKKFGLKHKFFRKLSFPGGLKKHQG